jgi:hypothetical protein
LPELRGALHRRLRRVRTELWPILQTTVAAGAAWAIATTIHSKPFFAPVSAVISLGVARGRRSVRAIELTVGVAVGIAVAGQVLFPRDPLRAMAKAARPVVEDLAVALALTAEGLRDGDEGRARRALEIARATDDDLAGFFDAVALARETFVLRGPARRTRERLPLYAEAAQQMDYAVRNTRVLARRTLSAIRRGRSAPPELADAVDLLAEAVRALGNQLDEPGGEAVTRRLALEAAVKATSVLDSDPGLSMNVIIGQVRSTAIDLLRGSGLSGEEARNVLDAAVERASCPALGLGEHGWWVAGHRVRCGVCGGCSSAGRMPGRGRADGGWARFVIWPIRR